MVGKLLQAEAIFWLKAGFKAATMDKTMKVDVASAQHIINHHHHVALGV